jgi:voltage-gated potassium channel
VLFGLGTLGYMWLEDLSAGEAAYLTVITLTTVGYGDVVPRTGGGRLFTAALLLSGLGTVLYLASVGAQMVLEGHLRDLLGRNAMQRRIDELRDHVIVCGYGRFGQAVADELRRGGADLVVVDADPAREDGLRAANLPYLIGSGLADDVLERAGIRRARALVVATPSDPDNVFITLSAREKSKTIRIHARGETEAGLRRLVLAGAHQALSAYHSGGIRMAASILRPAVVDFLELSLPGRDAQMTLEEIQLEARSSLGGRTIAQVEQDWQRVRVVGLRRGDEFRIVPEGSTVLEHGDLLVVIGEREVLGRLAQAAAAG